MSEKPRRRRWAFTLFTVSSVLRGAAGSLALRQRSRYFAIQGSGERARHQLQHSDRIHPRTRSDRTATDRDVATAAGRRARSASARTPARGAHSQTPIGRRRLALNHRIEHGRHRGANQPRDGSWLSTARWAMRSARLAGRLFSTGHGEARQAGEAIIESFDEPIENAVLADDQVEPAASTDPSAALRNVAGKASVIRKPDRSNHERVVLFAPGPVTEASLFRENRLHAAIIRRRHRRLRRFRWLIDNVGTMVAVIILYLLVWFVTGR